VLDLSWQLEARLPGTRALFRTGVLSRDKAAIIAWATALLDPAGARAAEAMVLDRAAQLTPPGLRAAINAAVMQVDPENARKRREDAARLTRVERWAEGSGNAGLAGRELPPAEVLAAGQRVTAWAPVRIPAAARRTDQARTAPAAPARPTLPARRIPPSPGFPPRPGR
jgi:hypothetical protein